MADDTKLVDVAGDAVIYPILTKEVGSGSSRRNGDGSGGADSGLLTRSAKGAISDLLGWRYRADDPKGFLAALSKAVDLREVEGHVESTWKARPFMVKADLGEVTGAQASIYERARVSIEHALPLLDTLEPLRPDADDEETASIRALVRSSLTELLTELGSVGGPRIQRVNDYLGRLLEIDTFDPELLLNNPAFKAVIRKPETVKGMLGELKDRFGLDRSRVLTVSEERHFTNFLIIVDYTSGLLQTWVSQKSFLERNDGHDKFLGTQLVRLSQALHVIVESVNDAYDAMDSVFFGPDEREVTEFSNDEPRMTVAELLSWVEHFANVEAPQLIEDSGKDGVDAVRSTLSKLAPLVEKAIGHSEHVRGKRDDK